MSRYFHGTTIACKYSPEFRGLVYKINPHDISCMYKRMFEMCATNTLIELDSGDIPSDKSPKCEKFALSTGTVGDVHNYNDIEGWQVCSTTNSWQTDGTDRIISTGCHQLHSASTTTRSQSAFAKLEYHTIRDDRVKCFPSKLPNSSCRKTYSTEAVGSRSFECRLLSPRLSIHCNLMSSFNQIPFQFQHHGKSRDHIDQYREHYTQRRMKMLRTNVSEYRSYPVVLAAPPVLQRPATIPLSHVSLSQASKSTSAIRCFDVFGSTKDVSMTTGTIKPTPKRPIKKKTWTPQKSTQDTKPSQSVLQDQYHQNGGINLDIGNGFRRMLASEDCISSQPDVSHRLKNQLTSSPNILPGCRSRPTIPSKSRGSANDSPAYVVTYLKK